MPGSRSAPTPTMPSLVGGIDGREAPRGRRRLDRPCGHRPACATCCSRRSRAGLAAEVAGGRPCGAAAARRVVRIAELGVQRVEDGDRVSRPTRSSSANGPIGKLQPPFIAASMSSRDAVPCSSMRTALLRYGNSSALTMNPARSLTSTGFLAARLGELPGRGDRLVAGGERTHHLDEAHRRRGVEEVDAAHPLGPLGLASPARRPAASRCWWRGSRPAGSSDRARGTAASSRRGPRRPTRSRGRSRPRSLEHGRWP